MQVLCVTSIMYDECNVIMTRCDNCCDESLSFVEEARAKTKKSKARIKKFFFEFK
jgi:hypothetical protein